MNRLAMESLARKHWAKWLPKKVAQLKADGELSEAIQGAATRTERERADLMAQGYQLHEAEEVALPMFILLKPEPEANEEPWETAELAAQERQHRKTIASPADDQE